MKCKICKKRKANTRHAKDYNHSNIKAQGNCVRLCEECHMAFHHLNHKNNLDWYYMIKNKKQEIIKLADILAKRKIIILDTDDPKKIKEFKKKYIMAAENNSLVEIPRGGVNFNVSLNSPSPSELKDRRKNVR